MWIMASDTFSETARSDLSERGVSVAIDVWTVVMPCQIKAWQPPETVKAKSF